MKIRALAAICLSLAMVGASVEANAMPMSGSAPVLATQSAVGTLIDQVQYRRGVRGPAPRVGRGVGVRRGGNGGAAAAAIIGLGVLGAIAAGSAASAAPAECWIERRRIVDDWGRTVAVRRVRVCR